MITLASARALVLSHARATESRVLSLDQALGKGMVHDVVSDRNVPGFRNSAMDGYALNTQHVSAPSWIPVSGIQAAGEPPLEDVPPGNSVRVMTGAVVPSWADAVVPRENVDESRGSPIHLLKLPKVGWNIRHPHEDIAHGSLMKLRGRPLSPTDLGVLASLGKTTVAVHRAPRASLICTGGELLEPHDIPRPGGVVNSSRFALEAALQWDGAHVERVCRVTDSPDLLRQALLEAKGSDVILTTGGVSMGDFDHLKALIPSMGMQVLFHHVAIKPGKPLMVATWEGTLVFALPGNPVSSLVTYELCVRPALRVLRGFQEPPPQSVIAGETLPAIEDKIHVLRVAITGQRRGIPVAHLSGPQGSGILSSFSRADGLICVDRPVEAGDVTSMTWIAGKGPWF